MKTIAFLGDSITYGYGLTDRSARYSTLIAKEMELVEENYGITGTLVAKTALNATDGKDFVSRVGLIDNADIAVIFGGTNDYFWSDKPIFGKEDDAYFAHAVDSVCRHIIEKRKGKVTLFVTPYPHNGVGNFLGGEKWNTSSRHDTCEKNYNGHVLLEYVSVIEATCKKYGIPCLDLHQNFDFDWKAHTLDGCHPNEEGHRLLKTAIKSKLISLLF